MCVSPFAHCAVLIMGCLQIDLKGDVTTVMVTELGPQKDYALTLYAVYPNLPGDSAEVTVQTRRGSRTQARARARARAHAYVHAHTHASTNTNNPMHMRFCSKHICIQ